MMDKKWKLQLIVAITIVLGVLVFYYLYGFLLPFIIGLALVYAVSPIIQRIQRWVKSRNLAAAILLGMMVLAISLVTLFFIQNIKRDFVRFSNGFSLLAVQNSAQLDEMAQKAKGYLSEIYDFEQLKEDYGSPTDSIQNYLQNIETSELDMEGIKSTFEKVLSVFQGDEEASESTNEGSRFSFLFIAFSSILYFVLILFEFPYFERIRAQYIGAKGAAPLKEFWEDFKRTFLRYFRLRSQIVFLLGLLYLITFWILDMPGTLMLTFIIIVLSYIPYLQYIALVPLSIGCIVLSVEQEQSFLFFFAITVGLFVAASIIEEVILNPLIMERHIGLNPVIMVLGLSIWSYLLGWVGVVVGIPLTSLLLIYFKRYLLPAFQALGSDA